MKKSFLLLCLVFFIFCTFAIYFFGNSEKRQITHYWWQDNQRSTTNYTLLLGSSSIARLPMPMLDDCLPVVIYGFNNGTTESIHRYLKHAKIQEASKIILYIGENDIARGEAHRDTLKQVIELVDNISTKVSAPIGLVTLKYSPARQKFHSEMLLFNQSIQTHFAESENVSIIPFDTLSESYLYLNDGVHLNQQGYMQFTGLINRFCK